MAAQRYDANLRVKRSFSVIGHSEDSVELRSGVWNPTSYMLHDDSKSGKLFVMVKALDGSLSPSEVARASGVPRSEVEALIDHLIQLGVVASGPSSALDHYIDSVAPQPLSRYEAKRQVDRPVLLLGDPSLTARIGSILSEGLEDGVFEAIDSDDPLLKSLIDKKAPPVRDSLSMEKWVETFQPWQGKFVVLALQTIDPVFCSNFNYVAFHLGIPWIHAAIDGPFLFVGPTFMPNSGPCYDCFETRVSMNLREYSSYQHYKRALVEGRVQLGRRPPFSPPLEHLLASHTAMETINYLLSGYAFTFKTVLAIYLPIMEIAFNEVLRLAGCRTCGSVSQRDDQQLYFDLRTAIQEAHGEG